MIYNNNINENWYFNDIHTRCLLFFKLDIISIISAIEEKSTV